VDILIDTKIEHGVIITGISRAFMLKESNNVFMDILFSINEPYLALDIGVSIFHDTRSTM